MSDVWFIKRHGAWFRPDAAGYCDEIIGAGTFSEQVAKAYEADCEGITIYPSTDPLIQHKLELVFTNADRLRAIIKGVG